MKFNISVISFIAVLLLLSCSSNSVSIPKKDDAHLVIADRVDMGTFEPPLYKKFVTIEFENTGSDTLYVMSAVAECDCTEIEILTDRVPPKSKGMLKAYLDLSEYPPVPVEKRFFLTTNDEDTRHVYVTLIGTKK